MSSPLDALNPLGSLLMNGRGSGSKDDAPSHDSSPKHGGGEQENKTQTSNNGMGSAHSSPGEQERSKKKGGPPDTVQTIWLLKAMLSDKVHPPASGKQRKWVKAAYQVYAALRSEHFKSLNQDENRGPHRLSEAGLDKLLTALKADHRSGQKVNHAVRHLLEVLLKREAALQEAHMKERERIILELPPTPKKVPLVVEDNNEVKEKDVVAVEKKDVPTKNHFDDVPSHSYPVVYDEGTDSEEESEEEEEEEEMEGADRADMEVEKEPLVETRSKEEKEAIERARLIIDIAGDDSAILDVMDIEEDEHEHEEVEEVTVPAVVEKASPKSTQRAAPTSTSPSSSASVSPASTARRPVSPLASSQKKLVVEKEKSVSKDEVASELKPPSTPAKGSVGSRSSSAAVLQPEVPNLPVAAAGGKGESSGPVLPIALPSPSGEKAVKRRSRKNYGERESIWILFALLVTPQDNTAPWVRAARPVFDKLRLEHLKRKGYDPKNPPDVFKKRTNASLTGRTNILMGSYGSSQNMKRLTVTTNTKKVLEILMQSIESKKAPLPYNEALKLVEQVVPGVLSGDITESSDIAETPKRRKSKSGAHKAASTQATAQVETEMSSSSSCIKRSAASTDTVSKSAVSSQKDTKSSSKHGGTNTTPSPPRPRPLFSNRETVWVLAALSSTPAGSFNSREEWIASAYSAYEDHREEYVSMNESKQHAEIPVRTVKEILKHYELVREAYFQSKESPDSKVKLMRSIELLLESLEDPFPDPTGSSTPEADKNRKPLSLSRVRVGEPQKDSFVPRVSGAVRSSAASDDGSLSSKEQSWLVEALELVPQQCRGDREEWVRNAVPYYESFRSAEPTSGDEAFSPHSFEELYSGLEDLVEKWHDPKRSKSLPSFLKHALLRVFPRPLTTPSSASGSSTTHPPPNASDTNRKQVEATPTVESETVETTDYGEDAIEPMPLNGKEEASDVSEDEEDSAPIGEDDAKLDEPGPRKQPGDVTEGEATPMPRQSSQGEVQISPEGRKKRKKPTDGSSSNNSSTSRRGDGDSGTNVGRRQGLRVNVPDSDGEQEEGEEGEETDPALKQPRLSVVGSAFVNMQHHLQSFCSNFHTYMFSMVHSLQHSISSEEERCMERMYESQRSFQDSIAQQRAAFERERQHMQEQMLETRRELDALHRELRQKRRQRDAPNTEEEKEDSGERDDKEKDERSSTDRSEHNVSKKVKVTVPTSSDSEDALTEDEDDE